MFLRSYNGGVLTLTNRLLILALFGVVSLGIYLGTQHFVLEYLSFSTVNLLLPGEAQIPFIPIVLLLYTLVYFMPSWVILSIRKKGRMIKVLMAFLIMLVIHALFFVFMPVEYVLRPDLAAQSSYLQEFLIFMYAMDAPINTFPSMHVSFAFLSYFIVRRYWPQWSRVFLILAVATSISTVIIKQHYILDVVASLVLAALINALMINRSPSKAKANLS